MTKKERALVIAKALKKEHPDPQTELIHANDMQLAIVVMLSAQTTDQNSTNKPQI